MENSLAIHLKVKHGSTHDPTIFHLSHMCPQEESPTGRKSHTHTKLVHECALSDQKGVNHLSVYQLVDR